jgi:hypothetical protein
LWCSGTEKWSKEKQCNENLFLVNSVVRKGTKIAVSFFAEIEQEKRPFCLSLIQSTVLFSMTGKDHRIAAMSV